MSDWAAKRFWSDVTVDLRGKDYVILLDDRLVKTPAKATLAVPTQAMAAAIATLNIIQEENLIENVLAMGNHLRQRLQLVIANAGLPAEIRGPGLMIGLELGTLEEPKSELAARIQTECLEQGLMLLTCGPNGNVIRWVPPLNVTKAEIDSAVDIFSSCF